MLSVSPPPVMWANPLITPLSSRPSSGFKVTEVGQQQGFARCHSQFGQLRVHGDNPQLRKKVCERASIHSCANQRQCKQNVAGAIVFRR